MAHAAWLREALLGREIIGVNGEQTAVAAFGPDGALLESRDSGRTYSIAMRELDAAVALWGRLKRSPSLAELTGLGIPAAEAAFLVAFIVAIRDAPPGQDWLQGVQQTMTWMPT